MGSACKGFPRRSSRSSVTPGRAPGNADGRRAGRHIPEPPGGHRPPPHVSVGAPRIPPDTPSLRPASGAIKINTPRDPSHCFPALLNADTPRRRTPGFGARQYKTHRCHDGNNGVRPPAKVRATGATTAPGGPTTGRGASRRTSDRPRARTRVGSCGEAPRPGPRSRWRSRWTSSDAIGRHASNVPRTTQLPAHDRLGRSPPTGGRAPAARHLRSSASPGVDLRCTSTACCGGTTSGGSSPLITSPTPCVNRRPDPEQWSAEVRPRALRQAALACHRAASGHHGDR